MYIWQLHEILYNQYCCMEISEYHKSHKLIIVIFVHNSCILCYDVFGDSILCILCDWYNMDYCSMAYASFTILRKRKYFTPIIIKKYVMKYNADYKIQINGPMSWHRRHV